MFDRKEKNRIPVFVMTGFLSAGKTTLLNQLFDERRKAGIALCCIQFEEGEEELASEEGTDVLRFSIDELQNNEKAVAERIYRYLAGHDPDEIWVEWNGMLPVSIFQDLFLPGGRMSRAASRILAFIVSSGSPIFSQAKAISLVVSTQKNWLRGF